MGVPHWLRAHWGFLATSILVLSTFGSGLLGLDFGAHPDEWEHHLHVLNSATTGSLLPGGYYVYPSLIHWVSLTGAGIWKLTTGGIITEMPLAEFVLPARAIALAISVAGGWGLYFAGRRLAGSWAGFAASGIYLTSWHLAFHARWLAPDAMLASVTAFFIWALVSKWQFPASRKWALTAAALVGVATSTKYQGAALLIPLLACTWFLSRGHSRRVTTVLEGWLRDAGVALLAFVVTTPGALLEPSHFVRALFWNLDHYENGHEIYFFNIMSETIFDPVRYALAVIQYVATTMPSSFLVVSLGIIALATLGAVRLARENWRQAVLVLIAPILLLLYFSTLTVFFPRNFLLILPFIAVLSGVGVQLLVTRLPRPFSLGVRVLVVLALVAFSLDLWRAAATIDQQGPGQRAQALAERMGQEPNTCWRLSASIVESLAGAGLEPHVVTKGPSGDELVVFSTADFTLLPPSTKFAAWPGYVPGYFDWIGSREVDFSYYPSWPGEARLLVFDEKQRAAVGLSDQIVQGLFVGPECWSL